MAKIIDITDKLNFEQKPQIKIKDTVLTVNDEAVALLEILPKLIPIFCILCGFTIQWKLRSIIIF